MSMTKLLCGVAALPLVAGVALAAPVKTPMQLSDQQLDKVSAGVDFWELTISNESVTAVALHERSPNTGAFLVTSSVNPPSIGIGYNISVSSTGSVSAGPFNNSITCGACFINISNPALSVAAAFR